MQRVLTIPTLIGTHAERLATAVALVDAPIVITYGELEARSNAIAAELGRIERIRGAAIGLYLRRSAASVIAALGVMKSGAAYVPLDPTQPSERIAFTLRDAGIAAVLCDSAEGARFENADVLRLRRDGTLVSPTAATYTPVAVDGSDLAYIIYTSGSTGQPKGVEITHAGLANLCAWHRRAFDVTVADRASHLSAVGFDAAVWEVWPYLSAGARVHIADDAIARDAQGLADWLGLERITIAFVATPMAQRMLDLSFPPDFSLRTLLTGADTLHRRPPAGLPFALINNYGPTEATVVATSGRVAPQDDAGLPSIGRPIDNVEILILDAAGTRLPIDVEGEICIAGIGLARGYRGRPDLDALAFTWFHGGDGDVPMRVYRTGDRGRQSADGTIVFLGRIDQQVKVRGVRIEPREIEAALDAHAGILESAVIVRSFGPDDDRLVAFVVPRPGATVELLDLQAFLRHRLPAYMIPALVAALPTLPLTPNGKVDRAALLARSLDARETLVHQRTYIEPRSETEQRLAAIVTAVLKVERVSTDDDFFLLGGHSLLGTQLIARIRDAFGVKIGLRQLFDAPTICGLAREIDRMRDDRPDGAVTGASVSPFGRRARSPIPRRSA